MHPWIELTVGALAVHLAPEVGGAVARFSASGRPLMRPAPEGFTDALDAACFPLVPFSNRIRDGAFVFRGRTVRLPANLPGQRHPLHGQGWRSPWTLDAADARLAEMSLRHAAGDWPWDYAAFQTFVLDPAGLTVSLSVRNDSAEPMPAGLGLHPYFPCDAETVLDARVDGVWAIDDEIMPTAREPAVGRYGLERRRICGADLDNGYDGWSGRAGLAWPPQGLALDILSPGAAFFQVYAPAGGGVVVAEPVTHANAALNLDEAAAAAAGVVVLAPGETFGLTTRFEVRGAP